LEFFEEEVLMQKITPPQPGDANYDHTAASLIYGLRAVLLVFALLVGVPLAYTILHSFFHWITS